MVVMGFVLNLLIKGSVFGLVGVGERIKETQFTVFVFQTKYLFNLRKSICQLPTRK